MAAKDQVLSAGLSLRLCVSAVILVVGNPGACAETPGDTSAAEHHAQAWRKHFEKLSKENPTKYMISSKPVQTIEATYTFKVATPNLFAEDWLFFAAEPPEIDCQRRV